MSWYQNDGSGWVIKTRDMTIDEFEQIWPDTGRQSGEHRLCNRGVGWVIDAISRGLTTNEAQFILNHIKNLKYSGGIVVYRTAQRDERLTRRNRSHPHRRPALVSTVYHVNDAPHWWLYNQETGLWNPRWKRS